MSAKRQKTDLDQAGKLWCFSSATAALKKISGEVFSILDNYKNAKPAVFLAERLLLIDSLGKPAQLSQKLSQNERRACGDQGASLDSSGSHTVCTKT